VKYVELALALQQVSEPSGTGSQGPLDLFFFLINSITLRIVYMPYLLTNLINI
jgi:hypothetical protein